MKPATEPVIVDRARHTVSRKDISPEALKVLYRLKDAGHTAYLAGGGVRDLLLGRQPKDFDIATDAHPNRVKQVFRNCRLVGRRFRLAHVFFHNTIIEVSTFRANPPPESNEHPEHHFKKHDGVILRDNVFGTPADDAFRRDFTVNALFYNIADCSVIDHVGGLADLDQRLLRSIGDPRVRFVEDPVRMIRAVRFAEMLGFTIEASSAAAIRELGGKLLLASRERLHDEMLKISACGESEKVVHRLFSLGLLDVLFPAFSRWLKEGEGREVWYLKALRQTDKWKRAGLIPDEALFWAMLFGEYHEAQAQILAEREGLSPVQAALRAVETHLLSQENRVQVPRQAVYRASHLMAMQPGFQRTGDGRAKKMVRRAGFHEAFIYLKFSAGVKSRNQDVVAWWKPYA